MTFHHMLELEFGCTATAVIIEINHIVYVTNGINDCLFMSSRVILLIRNLAFL